MKMKKFLAVILSLSVVSAMTAGMTLSVSAQTTVPERLFAVSYSPKLDLYVSVANDGAVYTSGDGLSWGKTAAFEQSVKLGEIKGNSYYISPKAVIWNEDEGIFVLTAGKQLYTSADGFTWSDPIAPMSGSTNLELHTLYWTGEYYLAGTTNTGGIAKSDGSDLTRWTKKTVSGKNPVSGFTTDKNGVHYLVTTKNNAQYLYTSKDGLSWTDGSVSGASPYRTTDIAYSEYLDMVLAVGGNGSSSASTATGDDAIGTVDTATGKAIKKLQIKSGSPATAIAVHDKTIVTVLFNGLIRYRSIDNNGSPATDIAQNRNPWATVTAAGSGNTYGLSDIVYGKNGYVAVGGDPSHPDRTSYTTGGTAIFIPEDVTEGYKIAKFYDTETEQKEVTTLRIEGAQSVDVPKTGSVQSNFTVTARDQAGEAMEAQKSYVWSIKESLPGVSINNGVLSVTSECKGGKITITAADSENANLNASAEVILMPPPAPASVAVSGEQKIIKSAVGSRTYNYSAVVYDSIGIEVPEEMRGVSWSLGDEYDGVSVDSESGVLTVDKTAAPGEITITASSVYDPEIKAEYTVTVAEIGEITLTGPQKYTHFFANSARVYTVSPTVKDTDGETINEECGFELIPSPHNSGVAMTVNGKGQCEIRVSEAAAGDKITLRVYALNNPDVTADYSFTAVQSMIANPMFENSTNNWTINNDEGNALISINKNVDNYLLIDLTNYSGEECYLESEPVSVIPGAYYTVGFRSNVTASTVVGGITDVRMDVFFYDADGELIDFDSISDTQVTEKYDGHTTLLEFYKDVQAPADAASVTVAPSVIGPVKAQFRDIAFYPVAATSVTISSSSDKIMSQGVYNILSAQTETIYGDETAVSGGAVYWMLDKAYSGVSVNSKTGEITVGAGAMPGEIKVIAAADGNTSVYDEKMITLELPAQLSASSVSITTGTVTRTADGSADVSNTTGSAAGVTFISALYDARGRLIAAAQKSETIPSGDVKSISLRVSAPEDGEYTAKAFIWEGFDVMKPVRIIQQ